MAKKEEEKNAGYVDGLYLFLFDWIALMYVSLHFIACIKSRGQSGQSGVDTGLQSARMGFLVAETDPIELHSSMDRDGWSDTLLLWGPPFKRSYELPF